MNVQILASKTPEGRIGYGFQLVTSRFPKKEEITVLHRVFKERFELYGKDAEATEALLSIGESKRNETFSKPEHAAWTTVARTLLNLSETISKN